MKPIAQEPDRLRYNETTRNDVPLLSVAGKWEDLLAGPARESLEKGLPQFLLGQRWFGGKARPVETVRIADWTVLRAKPFPVFLVLLTVAFRDGTADLYALPLGVVRVPGTAAMVHSLRGCVVGRVSGPQGTGLLIDALADEAACEAILSAIANRRELATRTGLIRAAPTKAYAELRGSDDTALQVAPGPATSSNSLVRFGGGLLVKGFCRLETGGKREIWNGRCRHGKISV